jgi:hypothetical protein
MFRCVMGTGDRVPSNLPMLKAMNDLRPLWHAAGGGTSADCDASG